MPHRTSNTGFASEPLSATWYLRERLDAEASVDSVGKMMDSPSAPQNVRDIMDRRLNRLAEVDDICDAILADLESRGHAETIAPIRMRYYDHMSWAEVAEAMGRDVVTVRYHVLDVLRKLPCPYVPPESHA